MSLPSGGIPVEFAPTILGLFFPALLAIIIFAYAVRYFERRRKRNAHRDLQQGESQIPVKHKRRKRKLRAAR